VEADIEDPKVSKSAGTYRAALAAVIILYILLVLGVIGLAAGFARQYRLYQAGGAAPADGAAASIRLAPGAHIVSATSDAGKLVLHIQTPEGGEVEIIDLATGKLTGDVKESGK
jgi:hypothetical protein